jgi:hypothetical protein
MQIGNDLSAFLTSPVMIIVGSVDGNGRPDIARAMGARVAADRATVDLVISAWQWPSAPANLRATGRVAVTFSRPSDYVSYQLKGRASVVDPDTEAIQLSHTYMSEISGVLRGLGVGDVHVAAWLTHREPVIARVEVEAIFVQTPGPKAGQPLAREP